MYKFAIVDIIIKVARTSHSPLVTIVLSSLYIYNIRRKVPRQARCKSDGFPRRIETRPILPLHATKAFDSFQRQKLLVLEIHILPHWWGELHNFHCWYCLLTFIARHTMCITNHYFIAGSGLLLRSRRVVPLRKAHGAVPARLPHIPSASVRHSTWTRRPPQDTHLW